MKTTINLENFDFESPIFIQIDDCPIDGFPRVLVYKGDNFQFSLHTWFLNAEIYFINPLKNTIIKKEKALSKNEDWDISNSYNVTVFDVQQNPVANPNFNSEEEITEQNLPFATMPAFNYYGGIYIEVLKQLFFASAISDNSHGFFDKKDSHKTLVDIQKEFLNN